MKKKVGELYDKPIVIGNPNEFTKNEIALSDLGEGGEESFDDGMEYYKVNSKILYDTGADIFALLDPFFITSIVNGKLKKGVYYDVDKFVYACGNAKAILYGNVTGKNYCNTQLEEFGMSLNDTSIFEPITAKEYYSLLD